LPPVVAGVAGGAGGLMGSGEPVVGPGLLIFPADLRCQFECGGVLDAGMFRLAVAEQDCAEPVEGFGLIFPVAGLPGQDQRLLEVVGSLLIAA
jgi:hypothetical protein